MCLTADSSRDSWRFVCYLWTRGVNFQYEVALVVVLCVVGMSFVIGRLGNDSHFEDATMCITVVTILALALESCLVTILVSTIRIMSWHHFCLVWANDMACGSYWQPTKYALDEKRVEWRSNWDLCSA